MTVQWLQSAVISDQNGTNQKTCGSSLKVCNALSDAASTNYKIDTGLGIGLAHFLSQPVAGSSLDNTLCEAAGTQLHWL